jgi:hypothetical protein
MAKTIRSFVPRILVSPIHGILYWFNHGLEGEGLCVIHDLFDERLDHRRALTSPCAAIPARCIAMSRRSDDVGRVQLSLRGDQRLAGGSVGTPLGALAVTEREPAPALHVAP